MRERICGYHALCECTLNGHFLPMHTILGDMSTVSTDTIALLNHVNVCTQIVGTNSSGSGRSVQCYEMSLPLDH